MFNFGEFSGVVGLVLLICFLPWLLTEATLGGFLGESRLDWEVRRPWFTIGFWGSVTLLLCLGFWLADMAAASEA